MKQSLLAAFGLVAGFLLGGCSTVTGEWSQKLQIETLDAQNRPVEGLQCQIGEGSSAQSVTTPAHDVKVRRSAMNLAIACRSPTQLATATVKPRRERMEEALLPFGSVGVFVDHLSGALYGYPTMLRLRVGQHVVLEHGGEAQVASSEPLPDEAVAQALPKHAMAANVSDAKVNSDKRTELASAAPGPVTAQRAQAGTGAKPRTAASTQQAKAAVKPVSSTAAKTAAAAAAVRAPAATPPKLALSTPAAAPTSSAGSTSAGRSAPVNW